MKRVIIESPYAGKDEFEVERNLEYARMALEDSLRRGEAPIASHLLHTQVLDDNVPEERAMGISAGLSWMRVADKVAFYRDYGISEGMKNAMNLADEIGIDIDVRRVLKK